MADTLSVQSPQLESDHSMIAARTKNPTISPITTAPARIGTLSLPVTTAEWHACLLARDRVFGRHGLYQNPVPYWCYVSAGEFSIGGCELQQPVVRHKLREFWIARVPITVAQYRPFVAEGYRSDARCWWTPNGWAWKLDRNRKQPSYWDDARFTQPQQPVVGITWYEAMAYCTWLNERLSARITNVYQVRLPTAAEWEVAAAFDAHGTRWNQPWGAAAPSLELADVDRKWQDGAKPVGGRPRGAAGCGALDMVGTVWEVTSGSSAASPAHGHDALTNDHTIIWRGAAYWNNSSYVHCGACVSDYPGNGNVSDGFRIVVAPRIAD